MPELPEVETIRRGLEEALRGESLEKITILHPRTIRYDHTWSKTYQKYFNKTYSIEGVYRKGKYLWVDIGKLAIVLHLGMSGQFSVEKRNSKHLRAVLTTSNKNIYFYDQRTFGFFLLSEVNKDREPTCIEHIGVDVLKIVYTDVISLFNIIKNKKRCIKNILLDQTVLSGIGNIYADEALFLSNIHPQRPGNSLTLIEFELLISVLQKIMLSSIVLGGTSFDALYTSINGEAGKNSDNLFVYQKDSSDCLICGTKIKKTKIGGRSTHYCPSCQPAHTI